VEVQIIGVQGGGGTVSVIEIFAVRFEATSLQIGMEIGI